MPLDMTINLDRLRSVRLKLRRGLVKLTMCSALGLDERKKKKKKKKCITNEITPAKECKITLFTRRIRAGVKHMELGGKQRLHAEY